MSFISSYVRDESSGGLSGVSFFPLNFGVILNNKYISHPMVYNKQILLLKAIQMQMTYLFQTLIGKLFQGRLVIRVKFEFQLIWVSNFGLWYPNMPNFQCHRSYLIWMCQQKVIANLPKLLIIGPSTRSHLYYMPCVQYFVSVAETSTTYTLFCILLDETSLTQFGS